jgi:hypothetical protein
VVIPSVRIFPLCVRVNFRNLPDTCNRVSVPCLRLKVHIPGKARR